MLERGQAMKLTKEQLEAVRRGEPVRLTERGTDLVVLRADVFERLQQLSYDDSPWTDEEMDRLAAEDADALGWEGMEVYQDGDS
jgi:prevent-host-death family protein